MLLIIGIIVFTFSYSSLISSLYCVAWPICRPPPHTYALKTNCVHLIPPPSPTECAPECERCYGTVGKCTRCTACTSGLAEECRYESGHTLECATQCPVSPLDNTVSAFTINHDEYNYCGESVGLVAVGT